MIKIPWEESEKTIRSGHGTGPREECRTTDFDGKLPEGVQAVYCKRPEKDEWFVQSFIFDKEQGWTDGTKKETVEAYNVFVELNDISWEPPNYRYHEKLPFIPLESEIDALIASCSRRVASFLELLKETGMRAGEAWRLRWIDLDTKRQTVTVDSEKHGNPRVIKISSRLVGMLKRLPKESGTIFGDGRLQSHRCNFQRQRKRAAHKLNNPRILEISFHTLRHWKATMEYHKTKDILHVKRLLGHRNIQSTLIYTHMIDFESDEYHVRVAETLQEACDLLEAGFEYVTDMDGKKLFRKRK